MKTIKYTDDVIDLAKDSYHESPAHKLFADFDIMTEILSALINKIVKLFGNNKSR